jgi:hypothetical protein
MRKLLIASVGVASLAGAVPALAQGLPPGLAQTQSDVSASAVYGQNHGGWLTAWLFGRSEKAPTATASRENPQQQPLANRVGNAGEHATN